MNETVIWTKPNPTDQEEKVIGLLEKHFQPSREFSHEEAALVAAKLPTPDCSLFLSVVEQAARDAGVVVETPKQISKLKNALIAFRIRTRVGVSTPA